MKKRSGKAVISDGKDIAFHPGSYARDCAEYAEMNMQSLAQNLRLTEEETWQLLDGERDVDEKTAEKLAEVFGISTGTWLNLQKTYDTKAEQIENGRTAGKTKKRKDRH